MSDGALQYAIATYASSIERKPSLDIRMLNNDTPGEPVALAFSPFSEAARKTHKKALQVVSHVLSAALLS